MSRRSSMGITLLAVEKTIGGVFFLASTVVLVVLYVKGVTHPFQNLFAKELRQDPHDLLANLALRLVPAVTRRTLLTLAGIAAAYFVLHVVEATGLWLKRLWVEYLVLVETAAFLPYEVYEMVRHFTWFKLAIFAMNLAIVLYLAQRRIAKSGDAPHPFRN